MDQGTLESLTEGEDFADLVRREFYLQRTIDFGCGDGRLCALFDPENYQGIDIEAGCISAARAAHPLFAFEHITAFADTRIADAVIVHDVFKWISDADVVSSLKTFAQPRVIISEEFSQRGPMAYNDLAHAGGYDLIRCLFIRRAAGEIGFMEFWQS